MWKSPWWIVCITLMLAAIGCDRKEGSEGAASPEAERLKEEAAEAVDAARDFAEAGKDEFARVMQTNLDGLQAKMQEFRAKAQAKGAEAEAEFERQKSRFDEEIAVAKERLERVRSVSGDAWEETKDALEDAYEDLKDIYNEIAAKYE